MMDTFELTAAIRTAVNAGEVKTKLHYQCYITMEGEPNDTVAIGYSDVGKEEAFSDCVKDFNENHDKWYGVPHFTHDTYANVVIGGNNSLLPITDAQ